MKYLSLIFCRRYCYMPTKKIKQKGKLIRFFLKPAKFRFGIIFSYIIESIYSIVLDSIPITCYYHWWIFILDIIDLNIFYCQTYTIGLNTSLTTYMMFSPVSYKHRSDRVQECMTDNKCISIYNVDKNKWWQMFWLFFFGRWGSGYVPSVNRLLFLLNVCTAFDNKLIPAWSFW
jgi:hypothetical protein